ncbi:MAG: 4-alpha-glucanotransferase [Acidimicrobiia bacterium]|nr:4-alpha-glucanotransferase [Acidimicrobiia bacterium]MDX2466186.1 4-alpha-glucanotransferase [Acidimicrobiia bacterium]
MTNDHLLATLEALTGRTLTTSAQIEAALADGEGDQPIIEPVLVAWDGHLPAVQLGRPTTSVYLVTEQGDEIPVQVKERTLSISSTLPLGYHELRLEGIDRKTLVISAPSQAHEVPRNKLGLLAPAYSMRSADCDTGIGNFGHLQQLADTALITGAHIVGTLPLVATFPDQPSPYSPASRRAWNELLIDLRAAPGWEGELSTSDDDPLWVNYDKAGARIAGALAAYVEATHDVPQIRNQVAHFAASNPEMARYSAFRATCDRYGRNWRAWPDNPHPSRSRVDYHLTAQWLAAEQLGNLGRRLGDRGQYLYLDLPIGCNPDGFDIWDQPDLYAAASVGAPPDSLFLGGQDWGLPATIPTQSRLDGHGAYIKAVRHQLSVAGLLRIDHVMGLHRMWWVPHGLSATDGAYVMQPTEEMFAIVCLESFRAQAGVVGENLGTVPRAISAALETHRLVGMKVAQDGLKEPSSNDLIALSTHDTPPFAAWWRGIDIDDGEDLGVYTDGRGDVARQHRSDTIEYLQQMLGSSGLGDTRDAIMGWMAQSEAAIAIVNLDDFWAEEHRQNVPGTDSERPNWRARHRYTMEEIAADPVLLAQIERLSELRKPTEDGSNPPDVDNH